jgi:hypothetical protein
LDGVLQLGAATAHTQLDSAAGKHHLARGDFLALERTYALALGLFTHQFESVH